MQIILVPDLRAFVTVTGAFVTSDRHGRLWPLVCIFISDCEICDPQKNRTYVPIVSSP